MVLSIVNLIGVILLDAVIIYRVRSRKRMDAYMISEIERINKMRYEVK